MSLDSPLSISRRDDPSGREPAPNLAGRRLFLTLPGWSVGLKMGSERSFCSMKSPGQDYYHRLLDGELFVTQGDERVCFVCAERRGLLSYKPKGLRDPVPVVEIIDEGDEEGPGVYRREATGLDT